MRKSIFEQVATQLKEERTNRSLTQAALAQRVGRDPARISELERDLANNRLGRDRLTLLAEICDALRLVPILVPQDRLAAVMTAAGKPKPPPASISLPSTFEEVFVDLSDDEDAA